MWFIFALVCTLGWGLADLFYKTGTDETDRYSHLKIAVWVGLVMGAASVVLLLTSGERMPAAVLLKNAVRYAPASLSYIVSMVIGYAGLRYLELSIVSPVQNASGALSMVVMLLWFLMRGQIGSIGEAFSTLDIVGTVLIVSGVVALAVTEQRLSKREETGNTHRKSAEAGQGAGRQDPDSRYRYGALALLFPLLYCVFDTVGTSADGIILDGENGLGLGETEVLILYGLTFLLAGIVCWIIISVRTGKVYVPFRRSERPKALAAVCEEFGQIFYVYAMAQKPLLAAPMVASYCIVSCIFSGIFLKERLAGSQYACIISVILGIVLLGISEGLAA